jgi:hypothetical protein|tara:strand:- start:4369 stop:4884 length:516 start_codon:yes stop_codon:yes gene_type:complete
MQTTKQDIVKYQWKKGDNFGKVVEVKSKDSEFTTFTDGSKIFTNVLPEFLELVTAEGLPFPGAESVNLTTTPNKSPVKEIEKKVEVKESISPLGQLIKTLSAKNVESFQLSVGINLPKKEIFDMLVENSEEEKDQILEEISKSAVSQIEINNLQEFLNEQITEFVTNYYKL